MKKKIGVLICGLIIVVVLIIVIIERNMINKTKDFVFYLGEKYYASGTFNEITAQEFKNLIENDESFLIFVHQPFCATAYEFNKILVQFAEKYNVNFYKIEFEDMKEGELAKEVEYYPSFIIYREGEIVDFLEADADEDLDRYKDLSKFEEWLCSYVQFK